jgi:hypothetical protein
MSLSVYIEGDRSLFLSKTAVDRFKKDVKEKKPDTLNMQSYLKEGYSFKITTNESVITATIITTKEEQLEEKRKLLKQRLNRSKNIIMKNEEKEKLESLKRVLPDKLFKTYKDLVTKFQMPNIPSPTDMIKYPDRYRQQISTIMSTLNKVSDDNVANNAIKKYFNAMGNFLGIDPEDEAPLLQNTSHTHTHTENCDHINTNNSDTEDEDN